MEYAKELGDYFFAALAKNNKPGYKLPDKFDLNTAFRKAMQREDFPEVVKKDIKTVEGRMLTYFEIPDMIAQASRSGIIAPDISEGCFRILVSPVIGRIILEEIKDPDYLRGIEMLAEEAVKPENRGTMTYIGH